MGHHMRLMGVRNLLRLELCEGPATWNGLQFADLDLGADHDDAKNIRLRTSIAIGQAL